MVRESVAQGWLRAGFGFVIVAVAAAVYATVTYDHAWFADNTLQELGFLVALAGGAVAAACGIVAVNGPIASRARPPGVALLVCGAVSVPAFYMLAFAVGFGAGAPPHVEESGTHIGIAECTPERFAV